jgi:arginine exporter protein ArgO
MEEVGDVQFVERKGMVLIKMRSSHFYTALMVGSGMYVALSPWHPAFSIAGGIVLLIGIGYAVYKDSINKNNEEIIQK